MKIIYIHQYFKTPQEPGGTRSYWVSKELVRRGHKVVMITSTNKNHPKEKIEDIDGIEVHYLQNDYNNYMSKIEKVRSFIRFMIKSIQEAVKVENADMVFATSTPLTVGAVALALKRRKKLKYIFEVRDLWPEFPIQIGAIRNKVIIKVLRAFEKRIYKKAEHIVALSPGMRDGVIEAGVAQSNVTMIPNMSKPEEFFPHKPDINIAKDFGINLGDFNIIHFGSMGPANGLDYIIETARLCQEQGLDDIKFLFMGDGATLPVLKNMVNVYGLSNVSFLGNHKMAVVVEIVNLCDLSVTSFKNIPILATNSPNKLFDSLSAGKPIVVNSAGWTKRLVENENCGFYVDPENPQDFVEKIKLYKSDKVKLEEWGKNARRLSESKFNRSILSSQVVDIIESID